MSGLDHGLSDDGRRSAGSDVSAVHARRICAAATHPQTSCHLGTTLLVPEQPDDVLPVTLDDAADAVELDAMLSCIGDDLYCLYYCFDVNFEINL